jgi:hypothetical protein
VLACRAFIFLFIGFVFSKKINVLQSVLATKTMTIKTACNTADAVCAGFVCWLLHKPCCALGLDFVDVIIQHYLSIKII